MESMNRAVNWSQDDQSMKGWSIGAAPTLADYKK